METNLIEDPKACVLLRAVSSLGELSSLDSIIKYTYFDKNEAQELINKLVENNLLTYENNSGNSTWRISKLLSSKTLEQIEEIGQRYFINKFQSNFRVNVAERLEWIDGLSEMIWNAKKSLNENI